MRRLNRRVMCVRIKNRQTRETSYYANEVAGLILCLICFLVGDNSAKGRPIQRRWELWFRISYCSILTLQIIDGNGRMYFISGMAGNVFKPQNDCCSKTRNEKRRERLHYFNNLVTCLVFQSSIWWLIGENEANGTKHLMLSHSSIRWLTSKSSNGKCHTFLSWSIDLHFIKTKIYSQKIMLNIISYWFKM